MTVSFDPNIRMHNYDMFAGVGYEIDVSKPAGERIVNLTFGSEPLRDDQELVLALNNYRYGGLASDGIIDEKDLVFDSTIDMADTPAVRDMISLYARQMGELTPKCDENWKIVGANLDHPDAEAIYKLVREGVIVIPASEDGRTPNVKSLNAEEIRREGLLDERDETVKLLQY